MIKFINRNISYISTLTILLFFTPLFYYSFQYIINIWAFSDAFINYSYGFVRRGLLGEIILFLNSILDVDVFYIHSSIYLIFTIINIVLFVFLLKKISKNKFLYIFLLLNPALILFPLYDTGGYLRKEIIVLTLMLAHSLVCSKYHDKKISLKTYNKFLIFLNIPSILLLTLNHGIQFFLIPFHICLTYNVYFEKFNINEIKKIFAFKNFYILFYFLNLIPLIYFFINPVKTDQLRLIYEYTNQFNKNILWDPISYLSNPLYSAVVTETKNMFGSANALKTYSVNLFFALVPIIYIFNNFYKNNYLKLKNYPLIFLSIAPIFLLFLIGRDWGRWLNVLSFAILLLYLQFPLYKNFKLNFFSNKKTPTLILVKIIIISVCLYYLLFMMVPHCCNNTNYHMGGFVESVKMAYKILFGDFGSHLDNTFIKN